MRLRRGLRLAQLGQPLPLKLERQGQSIDDVERFEQLPREIRHYEPRLALVGGLEGLSVVRRLLQQVQSHMTRAGIILLEISEEQGKAAVKLAQGLLPWANIMLHQDLEGLDRVVEIQLAGT